MNPTNSLVLEIYYQNYVINTLGDIIQERDKEEELSLLNDDEWDDSKEDHENQEDEESMDKVWAIDCGNGYDYRDNEGPMEA